jgi:hypothetical protein
MQNYYTHQLNDNKSFLIRTYRSARGKETTIYCYVRYSSNSAVYLLEYNFSTGMNRFVLLYLTRFRNRLYYVHKLEYEAAWKAIKTRLAVFAVHLQSNLIVLVINNEIKLRQAYSLSV